MSELADGSPATPSRRLFIEMLREEWRLHSRLFSGRRFSLFPVFILLLVVGASELLVFAGQDIGSVIAGMHALAFFFGLNTGSIGFVGRDAIRDLLGDLTLLVFSARTLPLSKRRLFGVFLAKDLVYYSVLFLLPMALGIGPVLLAANSGAFGAAMGTSLLLWATLTGMFLLGIGATLAGLGLNRRGISGRALGLALIIGAGGAWLAGVDLLAVTPYGFFIAPSPARVAGSGLLLGAIFGIAGVTFDLSEGRRDRTTKPVFRRWNQRIRDPLATKTLLDLHRSSGGFGKVIFSAAILLGVTGALVDLAGQITGVEPSVPLSFGAILGLTGFTTYNWLTQTDDVSQYRHHPVGVRSVFGAKFRAFLLLGPIVGLLFYGLALVYLGSEIVPAVVGAVLLVGVATYVFGVTVALAGLSPNEFLFDTLLFAGFGLAMVVPLVPILVVGFAFAPVEGPLLYGLGVGGVILGSIGIHLYTRSLPRWVAHHRQ